MIVEVFNAETRVDPYHELAHMVAARLGTPPALFDEGTAVYVTERFGGDAMADFGHPGARIDAVVASNIDAGKYVPLTEVFAFSEIGSPKTRAEITYPQAGSFVSFLTARFGDASLRAAFRRLRTSDDPRVIAENARAFRAIYGISVEEAERLWRARLGRPLT